VRLNLSFETWTEDFAYILGVIYGDGSVFQRKDGNYVIRLHVKDEDFAEAFYQALKRLGLNPYKSKPSDGYWQVVGYSKDLALKLQSVIFNEIKEQEDAILVMFIRGLYDSEGCLTIRKRKNRPSPQSSLRILNTDKPLLNLCKDILLKLGVHACINRQSRKRDYFALCITSPYEIHSFLRKIDSSIKRKTLASFKAKLSKFMKFKYVLHLDWDYPIPEKWKEVWKEHIIAMLDRMNLQAERIITTPSPSREGGIHIWLHVLSARKLYETDINMLQWLCNDCPTRVWINSLRIDRGLRVYWNKLFTRHLWRKPLPEQCEKCRLRYYLNKMRVEFMKKQKLESIT